MKKTSQVLTLLVAVLLLAAAPALAEEDNPELVLSTIIIDGTDTTGRLYVGAFLVPVPVEAEMVSATRVKGDPQNYPEAVKEQLKKLGFPEGARLPGLTLLEKEDTIELTLELYKILLPDGSTPPPSVGVGDELDLTLMLEKEVTTHSKNGNAMSNGFAKMLWTLLEQNGAKLPGVQDLDGDGAFNLLDIASLFASGTGNAKDDEALVKSWDTILKLGSLYKNGSSNNLNSTPVWSANPAGQVSLNPTSGETTRATFSGEGVVTVTAGKNGVNASAVFNVGRQNLDPGALNNDNIQITMSINPPGGNMVNRTQQPYSEDPEPAGGETPTKIVWDGEEWDYDTWWNTIGQHLSSGN